MSALVAPAWAAAPSEAVASAVRAYFDAPEEAAAAFEALQAAHPEDDDVAWWLARIWLDQGRAVDATALLEGRNGRRVPRAHFAWLRARALASSAPVRARAELATALAVGAADDPVRREVLALAARLAWEAGDAAAALAHVRDAGGALPGFQAWAPHVATRPMRVEVDGHAWVVTSAGLAVTEEMAMCGAAAPDTPIEVAGPALRRADGGACLTPGTRADLAPGGDGWLYVAIGAPEGEGIFTIARCGAQPRALRRGPGMASPAWLGEELIWVEEGGARSAAGPLWEGAKVIRLTTGPPGVLAVVWEGTGTVLRYAPAADAPLVPLFDPDPEITRATWCPSPPAAPPREAPPPPPAHPR